MSLKIISLLLFIAAVVAQLLAQVYGWSTVDMVSKPVLIPALMGYSYAVIIIKSRLAFLLMLALFFSWLGDVLLIFQQQNSMFFIMGLLSFLTAHIIYTIIFRKSSNDFQPKTFTYATAFLLLIYGLLLVAMLWSGLGAMKIPVIFYTLVITAMGLSALFRRATGSSLVLVGAMLFITSDSLLALNKFDAPFVGAGFWIMSTYILAQFFIVAGMVNFFSTPKKAE
jgi:uncharacterized membrane protein YhhN